MKRKKMIAIIIVVVIAVGVVFLYNYPAFGRAPQGTRLERIMKSPNYRDGHFRNQYPTPTMTSHKGFFTNLYEFLFQKNQNLKPGEDIPAVKTDLWHLDRNKDVVVWFGHSSLFIQNGGKRFLVDPVLTGSFPTSLMFNPFKGTAIYTPDDIPAVDYLIITHDHWDHLDYNTVKALRDRVGKVICGLGIGEDFEYWGYPKNKIEEMDWNETYHAENGFKIHCLPARHFSGRTLNGDKTLWASYMIEGRENIFLTGDGGYDKHFEIIGKQFPQIDLAIMENGQYNKDWRYIHTMPELLPKEIKVLHPRKVLTIHNSKFALARHSWYEPLDKIYEESKGKSYMLLTPKIGEVVGISDSVNTTRKWW